MLMHLRWKFRQWMKRIRIRVTVITLLGVASALIAPVLGPFVPSWLAWKLGAESVDQILTILASSLLAIATFSLSALISSYSSVSGSTTPRIVPLLLQQEGAQNALGTFVGGFLFSLVGLIGLGAGFYDTGGRLVLFLVTLCVVGWLIASFLSWIDLVPRLGRVSHAMEVAAGTARESMGQRAAAPFLHGNPAIDDSRGRYSVLAECSGYVTTIDMATLEDCGAEKETAIYLEAGPGTWVSRGRPLLSLDELPDEQLEKRLRRAFLLDTFRTHAKDPRYGLIVLAEIAMKALSPGINDPGTAIQVLGMQEEILATWAQAQQRKEAPECRYPHVLVRPLSTEDLFEDAFAGIARYGAGDFSVSLRLQKALCALFHQGDGSFRQAARTQSALALKRSRASGMLEEELLRLEREADRMDLFR